MPKLTPAQMKAAVEEFKKKFTPGFYHGSPKSSIKKFDPAAPGSEQGGGKNVEAIFLTQDPSFANSFLPHGSASGYRPGSTVYPVSANLGKHFDYETPEGLALIKEYLERNVPIPKLKQELPKWMEKRAAMSNELNEGHWSAIEDPGFQDFLKSKKFDSFATQEGGRKNVGIFDPKNIRGKFAKYNPEDAESPEFMRAAGGAVGYAAGGAAKKVLEHARKLPFVHFSRSPSIAQLEPRMYGTGIKGQEASRLADAPDIKPRSYFYVDKPDVRPEQGLGPHKYQGMAEDIYPLHDDPMGFSAIAKQKSLDPYLMSQGIQQVNEAQHLNELERLIKQAGYKGYANNEVGLLFYPTPVKKAE